MKKPAWYLPDSEAAPESVFLNRRSLLQRAALAGAGAMLLPSLGCADEGREPWTGVAKYKYDFARNPAYKLDRPLTDKKYPAAFNNYYEFTTDKERVWKLAHTLDTEPWTIEIAGHCKKTGKVDLDTLLKKLPSEERLYRFRCVERWAMAVPWIGIPMAKFVAWAEPTSKAKYVRFFTAWRPDEMPTVDGWREKFPYYEALRMDEAENELALLATGLYGHRLPNQNGAPIRVVVPWKYGYKSPKSIVKIEFVEKQPPTFWNDANPDEYGFFSNVNPERPHPRWSQEQEYLIPSRVWRKTLKFNGYGEQVAALYRGMDLLKHH